jgi:hypothetical protein
MEAIHAAGALHATPGPVAQLRSEELQRFVFAKLSIDAKQRLDDMDQLTRQECEWWLARFGASDPVGLRELGNNFNVDTFDKTHFESKVLTPILVKIHNEVQSAQTMLRLADILARYAETRVMLAEAGSDSAEPAELVRGYSSGYGLYYLSDRLRATAATVDRTSPTWPAVSSRSGRFYVRCTLKLSKEAAEAGRVVRKAGDGKRAEALFNSARAYFAHARGRIDVQTRHLWQLPAERLAVQMLLVSAARVWGSICACEGQSGQAEDGFRASLWYATQAELVLEGLGAPDSLAIRLHFERAKTLTKLAAQLDSPADQLAHTTIASRDMAVVERLARDNSRWKERLRILRRDAARSGARGNDSSDGPGRAAAGN